MVGLSWECVANGVREGEAEEEIVNGGGDARELF